MRDAETIPPDSPSSRETAPPMMEVPTVATASPSAFSTEPTNSLDRYELLEPIGHGGMGSVFRARQRKPLDRIVALKLIRAGFAAPSIVARFVAEFRMQSRLEHPSIARVFDAGVNETGQPFFVMEYVPGKPLPVFADEHRLDIEARLKLFMDVCDAIAHAHARAVIHRDLKAANVLAFMQDGRPMVKVIDFGVAKILDETGEAKAYATQAGSSIGTFQTMSPEQAAGRSDLDTRTDVYSLGVMLYQLLIGRVPLDDHDVKGLDYFRLAKLVAEVEPTRPSERLARDENREAIAQMRQTKPEALISQLARELEWIPMYALRKDRERRYASAEQMREDIENYFSGRPLRAAPESRLYVARKFASRNRLALSAAGAVALVSVAAVGLISSAVQRERASQQRALEEKLTASALNDFMLEDLIGRMSPGESGVSVSLNDAFSSAVESFSGRFDSQPILQVRIRKTFAEALLGVGELDRAAETFASIEAELPRLPQLEDRFKAEVEMGAEEVRWRLGKIDS
ncbi:MAG TPA: serine/threonine-protein kinase, partial [Tepidisphaeraceae bacterium]|nr:serine/threonine-protein kinase [Tepidisphaeraceae bacterium]